MYKSNAAQSSPLGLYVCVLVTVYRHTPPSASILMFWPTWDLLGTILGGQGERFPLPVAGQVESTAEQSY